MMDTLYAFDIALFVFLNQTMTWSVLDVVMPFLTDLNHLLVFRILVVGLVVLAVWKGGERGRHLIVVLILAVVVSDQLNSFVLKEWFGRLRPCHELYDVRLLVDCGGGKSFPSSHAVNTATVAVVVAYFYPRAMGGMFALAFLTAYSRVYVGVHYPSDVVAGMVLGGTWGWGASALSVAVVDAVRKRMKERGTRHATS